MIDSNLPTVTINGNDVLPGKLIDEIAHNPNLQSMTLYQAIADILLEKSFSKDIYNLRDKIINVMGELDKRITADIPLTRNLKLVLDIAKISKINREQESRLVFEASFIALMYVHMIRDTAPFSVRMYENYESLYDKLYDNKEFSCNDFNEIEKTKLYSFANFMKIALLLMPKPKKAHLLDLVTRVCEGKTVKYITGSGQTILTTRRVIIFQFESGVEPTPRPPRKHKESSISQDSNDSIPTVTAGISANPSHAFLQQQQHQLYNLCMLMQNGGMATPQTAQFLSQFSMTPMVNSSIAIPAVSSSSSAKQSPASSAPSSPKLRDKSDSEHVATEVLSNLYDIILSNKPSSDSKSSDVSVATTSSASYPSSTASSPSPEEPRNLSLLKPKASLPQMKSALPSPPVMFPAGMSYHPGVPNMGMMNMGNSPMLVADSQNQMMADWFAKCSMMMYPWNVMYPMQMTMMDDSCRPTKQARIE